MTEAILLYLLGGAFAGLMSGLFAVGGGIIVVPILNFIFYRQGVPLDQVQHFALGTSLASIIFTSLSSAIAQHKLGSVQWSYVKKMLLGLLIGTSIGGFVASLLSTATLEIIFTCFLFLIGTELLLNIKLTKAKGDVGFTKISLFSLGIGCISSLVGVGGGSLTTSLLLWLKAPVHTAIGTSAATSFFIAIGGAISYAYNGWGVRDLPGALGYIDLNALFWIVLFSMSAAPVGVKLSHKLPGSVLKRSLALILYIFAFHMLWKFF